jgi:hypothetical protein
MESNVFLANIISIFHVLIILFVLLAPFSNAPYFLILHVTFSVCLLVHWYGNSNVCSLSMLESKLRGNHYTESFTHKFVAPIYDISSTDWSTVCYTFTILLMLVSVYRLYKSERWKLLVECYNTNNRSFLETYIECVKLLFSVN